MVPGNLLRNGLGKVGSGVEGRGGACEMIFSGTTEHCHFYIQYEGAGWFKVKWFNEMLRTARSCLNLDQLNANK